MSPALACVYIENFCGVIADALVDGHDVPLPYIGKLCVQGRAAKKGRNPQTGKPLEIPARKTVKLRMGAELKAKLN
jgi:DNA-binding protein HU-beta